jgi:hypothetical protein
VKFLVDQDVYGLTVEFLRDEGHDVLPVARVGLAQAEDIDLLIAAQDGGKSLLDARKGFTTKLSRTETDEEPLEPPPEGLFALVTYQTPIGEMSAYLGQAPEAGGKHPAIVWITGGFPPGGIDSDAWEAVSSENDQSAKAYRQAGLVMMYPTVRGSFGNPGKQETFYGEVDVMTLGRKLVLRDLVGIFAATAAASRIAKQYDLQYDGWSVE